MGFDQISHHEILLILWGVPNAPPNALSEMWTECVGGTDHDLGGRVIKSPGRKGFCFRGVCVSGFEPTHPIQLD